MQMKGERQYHRKEEEEKRKAAPPTGGEAESNTIPKEEGKQHHPKRPPDDPATRWGPFSENSITKKQHVPKKKSTKAKFNLCSMMPLFERHRPMQIAMLGARCVSGKRYLLFFVCEL